MFDKDGYPTDETLEKIKSWPDTNFDGLMQFVEAAWYYPDYFSLDQDGVYHISTGGWSGNEEVINALGENTMFWLMCWKSSRRGGHYEFEVPPSNKEGKEE